MLFHPYLSFSESYEYEGLTVGTSNSVTQGNGLRDKRVTDVVIPNNFQGKKVVEVGLQAFDSTDITSVFIPKSILYLNWGAFGNCQRLKEVIFEEGSNLQRCNNVVFWGCSSLEKLDFPETLNKIETTMSWYLFNYVHKLKCISYHGKTDFSDHYMFENTPSIHVAKDYPGEYFGLREVIKDGRTCDYIFRNPPPKDPSLTNTLISVLPYIFITSSSVVTDIGNGDRKFMR